VLSTRAASTVAVTVAVVDEDPKTRTRLAVQLGERSHAGVFSSLESVVEKTGNSPVILVIGPSFATADGMAQVANVMRTRPNTAGVLTVVELSTQIMQWAIRAGVADVIALPGDEDQLSEAVERAAEGLQLAPAAPTPGQEVSAPTERGRVSTVFSTKGGTGKSVVATNLAVVLARTSEKPVVLLDADLQFGDVAVMMKLQPRHTIVDAVANIDRLDVQFLKSLLIRHERSGVLVLPAPLEPGFADQVSGPDMAKIIDMLSTFAGLVVIDTPSHFNEVNLAVLERSDDIVLVAGMDIPAIKNVKIGLQVLRLLDMPVSRVKLLLNRANAKVKLDIGEVEKTLQLKADVLLASDILIPQSVNKGNPAVLENPKSTVAKSIEQLAELVTANVAR
jgi:pilus assembly protein CpaE